VDFLFDGPLEAKHSVLLAHGAGAAMDSPAMNAIAGSLADAGFRIARFEFEYMASRRVSSRRKPPPRAEKLCPEYVAAIATLRARGPLIVGGKSMGGRVASMIADEHHAAGLLCLGYPFHPVDRPSQLRTGHLADLKTPALIVQGTRDPFGTRAEVAGYDLSKSIEILWLEDGDHDLRPRKAVSGFSMADHLKTMAVKAAAWAEKIA
jgi:predicted alpha/beta-hydrolase family hydrolase